PGPRIQTVGLVPHRDRESARNLARQAAALLREHGLVARICEDDVPPGSVDAQLCSRDEFTSGLDVAISLGGDGTMLRTVDLVYECGAAVLGVNVGQMGYLTEVEPGELEHALGRLLSGDFEVEERMVLEVTVGSHGEAAGRWWALNEAVLEKVSSGRVVR